VSGTETLATKVLSASEQELELETETVAGEMVKTIFDRKQTISPPKKKLYRRINTRGKLLEIRMEGEEAAGQDQFEVDISALEGLGEFPEKDLKPNDTWTQRAEIPLPGGSRSLSLNANSRFLGMATFKGRSCAKIRTYFQLPMDMDLASMMLGEAGSAAGDVQGQMTGTFTTYFDPALGRELYTEGTIGAKLELTVEVGESSQTMTMKMKFNVKSALIEK
jgi:hypothetical protein